MLKIFYVIISFGILFFLYNLCFGMGFYKSRQKRTREYAEQIIANKERFSAGEFDGTIDNIILDSCCHFDNMSESDKMLIRDLMEIRDSKRN